MTDQNDHDLLIELKTSIDMLIRVQSDFMKQYAEQNKDLTTRVTILENSDSRDSERFKSIADQISRTLNNASKIETLTADMNNLAESIRDLKGKSNLWDIVNTIGLTITGTVGYFFGGR